MARAVIVKLNDGLGTSTGLDAAKTLLPVRNGKNSLDIIVAQVLHARRAHQVQLPPIFMDIFHTRTDTLAYLERYPVLKVDGLPLDFLQNREPSCAPMTSARSSGRLTMPWSGARLDGATAIAVGRDGSFQ